MEKVIAPYYPSSGGRGRPPIGLVRMLHMYVVQQCFGLSDEGAEDALYDSQANRRFVGVDLSREAAPDATTLLNFRYLLEAHQGSLLFENKNGFGNVIMLITAKQQVLSQCMKKLDYCTVSPQIRHLYAGLNAFTRYRSSSTNWWLQPG